MNVKPDNIPTVAIVHGEDPFPLVREALTLIHAERIIKPTDRIVLKPNYVEPMKPETGVTTDPRVLEAAIV